MKGIDNMKAIFKFEGIDCANCALKLENKLNKIEGINNCNINFLSQRIIFDYQNSENLNKAIDFCKDFEDGVILKRIG